MSVQSLHIILIVCSVLLFLFLGNWFLNHTQSIAAYTSFISAAALIIYAVFFIKKTRAV